MNLNHRLLREKKGYTTGNNRFPVGDEIQHYLILGNVLLARAKLLVPGLLTGFSGQTPAGSCLLSAWDLYEEAEGHFNDKSLWFEHRSFDFTNMFLDLGISSLQISHLKGQFVINKYFEDIRNLRNHIFSIYIFLLDRLSGKTSDKI